MNNIKKIITERLENARNDWETCEDDHLRRILLQQVFTYQDCLNLMQPRTEQEILNDFELLGYEVKCSEFFIHICYLGKSMIIISKAHKLYQTALDFDITMKIHKLLNELFTIWGWL